jgi:hypothetical protein
LVMIVVATSCASLIQTIHHIDSELASSVTDVIFALFLLPLFSGPTYFVIGILTRNRQTKIVGVSSVVEIVSQAISLFSLLHSSFIKQHPVWLPVACVYVGKCTSLATLFWAFVAYARPLLDADSAQQPSATPHQSAAAPVPLNPLRLLLSPGLRGYHRVGSTPETAEIELSAPDACTSKEVSGTALLLLLLFVDSADRCPQDFARLLHGHFIASQRAALVRHITAELLQVPPTINA